MSIFQRIGDEGYLELAARIVREACIDYRKVIQGLLKDPPRKERERLILEKEGLEEFFYSGFFSALSDCDPGYLITKITEHTVHREKQKAEERIRRLKKKREKERKGLE